MIWMVDCRRFTAVLNARSCLVFIWIRIRFLFFYWLSVIPKFGHER